MRIESSLLVDLNLERPSVIDQLRSQLVEVKSIEGRVISELNPGRYQVMVGGRRLVFMPTRPLQVGAEFTAQLAGGRLVLDFPEGAVAAARAPSATGQITVRTLPDVLAELGLPADPRYMAVVQGLLRAGVSLTSEAVQLFHQHAGAAAAEDPLLLAFLIQRAIPVDASILALLGPVFREQKTLGETLPRLLAEGEALLGRLGGQQAAGALAGFLERLRRYFARFDFEGSLGRQQEEIRRIVAQSGLFREGRWALALAQGEEQGPLDDLKSLLLELEAWARQPGREAPERMSSAETLGRLAGIAVDSIEGAQLSSVRAPWESHPLWFVEVPFWIEGRLESFLMVIEGENTESGQPMAMPIRVDLFLELSQLGRLRVALTLHGQEVTGQVLSDQEEVVRLINEAMPAWLESRSEESEESLPRMRLGARQVKEQEELAPPLLLRPRWGTESGEALGRVDLKA